MIIIHSEIRILKGCLVIIIVDVYGGSGEIIEVSNVASHLRMVQS